MSTALFFITHNGIASNLLSIAEAILQKTNTNLSYLEIPMDMPVEKSTTKIESKLQSLEQSEGLLFITDLYGGTPSNIAKDLAYKYKTNLITGVNLPMVIRLLNYRDENFNTLLKKALDGGHLGIEIIKN